MLGGQDVIFYAWRNVTRETCWIGALDVRIFGFWLCFPNVPIDDGEDGVMARGASIEITSFLYILSSSTMIYELPLSETSHASHL